MWHTSCAVVTGVQTWAPPIGGGGTTRRGSDLMGVFAQDDHLLEQYTAFARSFTRIRASEIQNKVDELYAGRRFWPEPLIQFNPHYEGGGSIQALVGPKGLIADCAEIFRDPRPDPADTDTSLKLRRHQEQEIGRAHV